MKSIERRVRRVEQTADERGVSAQDSVRLSAPQQARVKRMIEESTQIIEDKLTKLLEARYEETKETNLMVWQQVHTTCRILEEKLQEQDEQVRHIRDNRLECDARTIRRHAKEIEELGRVLEAQRAELGRQMNGLQATTLKCDSNAAEMLQLTTELKEQSDGLSRRLNEVEESLPACSARIESVAAECASSKETTQAGLLTGVQARVKLEQELECVQTAIADLRDALDVQDKWRDDEASKAMQAAKRAEVKAQQVDVLEEELRRIAALKGASFNTRCLVCCPAVAGGGSDLGVMGPGLAASRTGSRPTSPRAAAPKEGCPERGSQLTGSQLTGSQLTATKAAAPKEGFLEKSPGIARRTRPPSGRKLRRPETPSTPGAPGCR